MVIEAGRKALIEENQLETVYAAARSAYFSLAPEHQKPGQDLSPVKKQRLIATVCLTGEGTAQMLQDWLDKQLQEEDRDVDVRAIRIDPVTRDSSMLSQFKNDYQLIAIVGTIPVAMEDVPFIPALELLRDDGLTRLRNLLEMTRPHSPEQMPKPAHEADEDPLPMDEEEMLQSASVGLARIVHHLNPQSYFDIINKQIEPIKNCYRWDVTRELGMVMHLGCLIDQMIEAELQQKPPAFIKRGEGHLFSSIVTDEDRMVWAPLLEALEACFHIHFDAEMRHDLITLGKCEQQIVPEP
jgi:transcriptional regulatory protein LevR